MRERCDRERRGRELTFVEEEVEGSGAGSLGARRGTGDDRRDRSHPAGWHPQRGRVPTAHHTSH